MRDARVLLVVLAAGCGGGGGSDDPQSRADAEARAAKAIDALGGALMRELGAALAAGGPSAAIGVCSETAPRVAKSLGEPGLSVRRTTLRPRNPANAPDTYERSVLDAWDRAGKADPVATVADGPDGRELRLMRPIRVMPLCLSCHGPAGGIAPEVSAEIAKRYPLDMATGYRDGDLRGAFSVRVRLAR